MDRVNFYDGQNPTPNELNLAFDKVENAINGVRLHGIGYGWQYGGFCAINSTDLRSLDVGAFHGTAYPNGKPLINEATINLKTTHSGYTEFGTGGQADGSAITVPSGHRMWVNIEAVSEITETDLRKIDPMTYWLKSKTFKFRLTAGASAEASGYPAKPSLPTETNNHLVLCDVLLKNTGGTTTIELIDNSRRTRWQGGKLNPLYLGTPAILSECKLADFDTWAAGEPYDEDGFLDPDDGIVPDIMGCLVWTKLGGFLRQRVAAGNDGAVITFAVINGSDTTVTKTLTIKSKPHAATSGADFMEAKVVLLGAPYDAETGTWQETLSDTIVFSEGSIESRDFTLNFVPGRNLVRIYLRNIDPENNLTICLNQFLDNANLYPDREMLEGILQNGTYGVFNAPLI